MTKFSFIFEYKKKLIFKQFEDRQGFCAIEKYIPESYINSGFFPQM